jgi:uncharacterized Zn finger protein (UPF0148 family)
MWKILLDGFRDLPSPAGSFLAVSADAGAPNRRVKNCNPHQCSYNPYMAHDRSWLDSQPRRLGDLIDDYCPRCKLLLNHAIASFFDGRVVKVICQTCHTEHAFLEGKEKKKAAKTRSTAFEQVLAKVSTSSEASPAPAVKKPKSPARYISRRNAKPSGVKK